MPKRVVYADDEVLRNALDLARRLPPTGRKPAEYLLATAVMELNERLAELQIVVRNYVVAGARAPGNQTEEELDRTARALVEIVIPPVADQREAS